ncbi:MAG: HAMP domain-containing histidine kinase [Bacteroidaceae bacterium]|nr:HAMP domain-containing histidine kinase [Bacteroidaceae bacterium]
MKRWVLWVISISIGVSFVVLLLLQSQYTGMMVKMRKDQFDESVKRSLDQASHDLERNETFNYLEGIVSNYVEELAEMDGDDHSPHVGKVLGNPTLMGVQRFDTISMMPRLSLGMNQRQSFPLASQQFQMAVRNAYLYQKGILDEVIYSILYNASENSFEQRINPKFLDACLRMNLEQNGVTLPFHFTISTSDGREVYRCPDYEERGGDYTYTQTLFRNDPANNMGIVRVHFPGRNRYVLGVARLMVPAMVFTFVLFITFMFTIYLFARQRKINEMKNDFVNNMTHEFKTPIASLSLAAQMLADDTVKKTPAMYDNLGKVIDTETKRLRYQVEKVLQMSLYDHDNIALKPVELNADELLENIIGTSFALKVERLGGIIDASLEAENPNVYFDEMHLTNVISTLLDNAVKYRRDDVPLHLAVSTHNMGQKYVMSIRDNGIGIKKEDLKRIFEKFYRVHTGNQHNVKGFGIGLAYVKNMVRQHKGTIKVESEPGQGTTFTIMLPTLKT